MLSFFVVSLEVSPGTTAHGCLNRLISKFSRLEEIRNCMVLTLNEEYALKSAVVKDRGELDKSHALLVSIVVI
ncbi:molybdopterin synthase sulfur carrier subunit [Phtheirospermum japonicum]|uniref:Molybdopterin synthase sulfur carrier subunit n=1 Tax=Phtheirospermum japonicum TaxID=374723 RepID=A0A830CTA2_9LAMI|nr:molybdopterin synthase sulfur carrier subunit [Phtheirospermum japonicum]